MEQIFRKKRYQEFDISFALKEPEKLEFRVWFFAAATVWWDRITRRRNYRTMSKQTKQGGVMLTDGKITLVIPAKNERGVFKNLLPREALCR